MYTIEKDGTVWEIPRALVGTYTASGYRLRIGTTGGPGGGPSLSIDEGRDDEDPILIPTSIRVEDDALVLQGVVCGTIGGETLTGDSAFRWELDGSTLTLTGWSAACTDTLEGYKDYGESTDSLTLGPWAKTSAKDPDMTGPALAGPCKHSQDGLTGQAAVDALAKCIAETLWVPIIRFGRVMPGPVTDAVREPGVRRFVIAPEPGVDVSRPAPRTSCRIGTTPRAGTRGSARRVGHGSVGDRDRSRPRVAGRR
jgi:hypothetical protein